MKVEAMKQFYDDKGKVFTDYITKTKKPVIIQTEHHTIRGEIHLRPRARLIDELNSSDQFLAITDVTIGNLDGIEIYKAEFFTINLRHIVWILPVEEICHSE